MASLFAVWGPTTGMRLRDKICFLDFINAFFCKLLSVLISY